MDKPSPKQSYGLGRVAFKAHLADIQREMDAGYTMALIYEKRKASLGISYSQFARHVQRYIRDVVPKRAPVIEEEFKKTEPIPALKKPLERKPFTNQFELIRLRLTTKI
jgi:Family of unknown function (DUF5338)